MKWVIENWFWIVVFVAFFAVHLFGHGGHGGGHGGHGGPRPSRRDDDQRASGHRH